MELRFQVDPHLIERIQERTNSNARGADIAIAALSILDWTTAQVAAGRDIVSMDPSGSSPRVFESPIITQARGNREV